MLKSKPITTQVLECLERHPACGFQTLVADCSEFTWNQLFYEVDRMRQLGQLCLTPASDGNHFIGLPHTIGGTMKAKQSDTGGKEPRGVASNPSAAKPVDRRIWIAKRAYQLYEEQSRQDGHALDHWFQAEREIRSADSQKTQ